MHRIRAQKRNTIITGTSDFFGLNYYGGGNVTNGDWYLDPKIFDGDKQVKGVGDPNGLE